MTRRSKQPVLITDAERSQDDQLHSRQMRYFLMMGGRVVCLVLAAVLVAAKAPLLWLWVPLLLVGMVLLPWLAVLIANDRPVKEEHRLTTKLHRDQPAAPADPTALTAEPARTIKIIDVEGDSVTPSDVHRPG